jgi:hypothetical protein
MQKELLEPTGSVTQLFDLRALAAEQRLRETKHADVAARGADRFLSQHGDERHSVFPAQLTLSSAKFTSIKLDLSDASGIRENLSAFRILSLLHPH